MKKKLLSTSTVLATLVGMAQMARADGNSPQFTPLEELAPEVRQEISAKVAELSQDMDIDWDEVLVGLDENGEISFRAKSGIQLHSGGGFSCTSKLSVEK